MHSSLTRSLKAAVVAGAVGLSTLAMGATAHADDAPPASPSTVFKFDRSESYFAAPDGCSAMPMFYEATSNTPVTGEVTFEVRELFSRYGNADGTRVAQSKSPASFTIGADTGFYTAGYHVMTGCDFGAGPYALVQTSITENGTKYEDDKVVGVFDFRDPSTSAITSPHYTDVMVDRATASITAKFDDVDFTNADPDDCSYGAYGKLWSDGAPLLMDHMNGIVVMEVTHVETGATSLSAVGGLKWNEPFVRDIATDDLPCDVKGTYKVEVREVHLGLVAPDAFVQLPRRTYAPGTYPLGSFNVTTDPKPEDPTDPKPEDPTDPTDPKPVTVNKTIKTSTVTKATTKKASKGQTKVTLTATVKKTTAGTVVFEKKVGKKWVKIKQVKVSNKGIAKTTFNTKKKVTIRARYLERKTTTVKGDTTTNTTFKASTSKAIVVKPKKR